MFRPLLWMSVLAYTLAHPPVDVPLNDTDVQAAAGAVVRTMTGIGKWRVFSARKQVVSGLNYFLIMGVATTDAPWPRWMLCTAYVYTGFDGGVRQTSWTVETAVAVQTLPTTPSTFRI